MKKYEESSLEEGAKGKASLLEGAGKIFVFDGGSLRKKTLANKTTAPVGDGVLDVPSIKSAAIISNQMCGYYEHSSLLQKYVDISHK